MIRRPLARLNNRKQEMTQERVICTNEDNNQVKRTIIVHERLKDIIIRSELSRRYKIRLNKSDDEIADIIFPPLRLAFMIVDVKDIKLDQVSDENSVINNMIKFGLSFQRSFILILVTDQREAMDKMLEIQLRMSGANCAQIIPCNNSLSAVNCIIELSKVEERSSLVQKRQQEVSILSSSIQQVGSEILMSIPGLSSHQADVLLHGMGSIAEIICAPDVRTICERTPIDSRTARLVKKFFDHDE